MESTQLVLTVIVVPCTVRTNTSVGLVSFTWDSCDQHAFDNKYTHVVFNVIVRSKWKPRATCIITKGG